MTKSTIAKSTFAKKVGISAGRVSHYIAEGFPVEDDGKIDEAKGREWIDRHVDPERSERRKAAGAIAEDASTAEAKRQKAITDARRAALELQQLEGSLVNRSAVERSVFRRARADRDAWRDWPLRIAADMASDLRTDERSVLAALRKHVDAHLSRLADVTADDLR